MILHTLNKPPSARDLISQMREITSEEDSILLLEDGTYNLLQISDLKLPQNCKLYAIQEDTLARGITNKDNRATLISYEAFVELTMSHSKVISWY